jgi:hypothetical protein
LEELLPRVRGELGDVPTGFEIEIEGFLAACDRGLIEVAEPGTG